MKSLSRLMVVASFLSMMAVPATASHFRYGHLTWQPTGATRTVKVTYVHGQRGAFGRSIGQSICIGSVSTGDGTSFPCSYTVIAVDTANDYFVAKGEWTRTYAGAGPYTAQFSSCCRLSNLVNYPDGSFVQRTSISPASTNTSPVSTLPSIVNLPAGQTATFQVPANDPDTNTKLTFRMASTSEWGGGGSQPAGLSINANSGIVSWNTPNSPGALYAAQVVIEDRDATTNAIRTTVPVDFVIKLVSTVGNTAPAFVSPTPANNTSFSVLVGQPLSFTVAARDTESIVTLNSTGLPTGATTSPALPSSSTGGGATVSTNFSWTPSSAGSFVVTFTATDVSGLQAVRNFTVNVGIPTADMALAQTASPNPVEPGGLITYELDVHNEGPDDASATISDTLPASVDFVSCSVTLVGNASGAVCSNSGNSVTVTVANIPVGHSHGVDVTIVAQAKSNLGPNTSISNSATVNSGKADPNQANNTQTVTITTVANAAPTAGNDTAAVNEDGSAAIAVLSNDSDANGDTLTITSASAPAHGSAVVTGSTITYTPAPNYYGPDSFQYTISDGRGGSASASVSVNVLAVNDPPTASNGSLSLNEDTPASVTVSAADIDGGGLTFQIVSGPSHGTLSGSGPGYTYTPAANYYGPDSFTFLAYDGAANSNVATVSINVAGVPDQPVITWNTPAPIVYGTALSATQLNATASFDGSPVSGTFAYSPAAGVVLNAGTGQPLQVAFTPADAANFLSATARVNIDVDKADPTVTATGGQFTYDGAPHAASASATGVQGEPLPVTITYDGSPNAPVDAGTYAVVASFAGSANYNPASNSTQRIVIDRAKPTVTATGGQFTYDGTPHAASASATGVRGEPLPVTITYDGSPNAPVNAGTYAVLASFAGNANYNPASNSTQSIVIDRATPTVNATGGQFTYDGAPHAASASATGVQGEPLPVTITYDGSPNAPVDAGTYAVLASFAGNANYNPASNSTQRIVIDKATPTVTATGGQFTYDGAPHTASASATGVRGEPLPVTITYDGSPNAPVNAGTYPVVASFAGNANYNAASNSTQRIVIDKATPTVTATGGQFTYDGTPHAASASATGVQGEPLPVTITYDGSPNAPVNAGTYAVVASFAGSANYNPASDSTQRIVIDKADPTVTATGGRFTYDGTPHAASASATGVQGEPLPVSISYDGSPNAPVNAGTYAVVASFAGSANYNPASNSTQSIVIDKADPTVTATGGRFTYDGTPHAASASATGVQGEPLPVSITYDGSPNAPVNAGTYAVVASFAGNANYNPASNSTQSIVIDKANPRLTLAGGEFTYDAQSHPATSSLTGVPGDNLGAAVLTYDGSSSAPVNAGTYAVRAVYAGSSNYNGAEASATIVIHRAPQTISWATPASIVYGTRLDGTQLNATASGVAGGTAPGDLTYSPAAGTMLNAGSHTLQVSAAETSNYLAAHSSVTLGVEKADQTISWNGSTFVYGTALGGAQLNATVSGVAGGSAPGALTYSPAAGTVLDAGARTVRVVAAATSNYNEASHEVTMDVTRAPLTVSAADQSRLYGQANPPLTGSLTGVVNNDPITASYSTAAVTSSNTGTYPITPSLNDPNGRLSNYSVTSNEGTLTVNRTPLSITVNDATKQYSDPVPSFAVTYSGFVLGETPSVLGGALQYATSAHQFSAPGSYAVTASGLTSGNYAISYHQGRLTVRQEDARTTYTGVLYASTTSPTTNQAVVTLRSTIRDITAVAGDPATDPDAGNILNATVTFLDRDTPDSTSPYGFRVLASNVPMVLISSGDERIASASASWVADIGNQDSASFTIGTVVAGYYVRDSAVDNAVVTVSRPTPGAVTGGGYLVAASSGGTKAADAGSKTNYGFNVKFNKNGKNVQGHFNGIIRRTEADGTVHVYQIKGNVMSSLVANTRTGEAVFTGKANLQDITNPVQPVGMGGNATLQVSLTDRGEPGSSDSIAITVWAPDGTLWFSSNWNGAQSVQQTVAGGNLQVH